MKLRAYGVVLSVFFALGLVFSFSVEASASHGDGTDKVAGDVDATDEEDVKAFLDHIIGYWNQVAAENVGDDDALTREVTKYGRNIRREGPYKHLATNMYSMAVNERGIVTNHARYPDLFGYKFSSDTTGSEVGSTIRALIDGSDVGKTECETYGDEDRVACARKVLTPSGNVTVMAGLHHEKDDSAFALPEDCADLTFTPNAKAVFDDPSDANLEAYVKGIIKTSQELVADITADVFSDFLNAGGSLAALATDQAEQAKIGLRLNTRLFDKAACFGVGDFKHGNIYAFLMGADLETSTVLFNGNNFDLNGTSLELEDDLLSGETNIAKLFNNELGGGAVGNNTYVNYHWDDPTDPDDDVPNFFEDRKVPGTSCKRSYIEVANLNALTADAVAEATGFPAAALAPSFPELPYIIGSGTYPGDDVCASGDDGDDDDGCAIAGAGHTSQSALLNLFLVASILFPVVFLRRRA